MKTQRTRRRALYFYKCTSCRKKRASLIYVRATGEICAKCRKNQVAENQPSLFEAAIAVAEKELETMVDEVIGETNNELTPTRQKSIIKKKGRKPNKKQQ